MASKLDKMLNSGRVAYIIGVIEVSSQHCNGDPNKLYLVLQESLFEPAGSNLSEEEERRAAEATLTAFREYLPSPVRKVLGQRFDSSTEVLFSALQHPRLNKQLALTLLEVVAVKIFPELKL